MSEKLSNQGTDREIFKILYKNNRDRLLASVTGMVRDRDRAEDITAAAFQTAWEKRAQFRGDSSLGTWLYAIGLNASRRSRRLERTVYRDPSDLETQRDPESDRLSAKLEKDELHALVWKALARVPAKSRQLLIDRYIEGLSVLEIARREGVPVGTIGSRLFTATRLLRKAWTAVTLMRTPVGDEKVRQMAEDALGRLAAALQAGHSQAFREYLSAQARFHRYSWGNVLLIQAQRPTATRVAGFHAWRQLERSVNKGEKGIMIFAPIVVKDRNLADVPADARSNSTLRVAGFRTAYVFDVEQTSGRPLPEFARTAGDPKEYGEKLKAFVAKQGIALEYDAGIAPAQGVSSGGRIRLVPGLAAAEEFSVLTHELAHELLHHGKDGPPLPKTVRETQAEAVAFVVSQGIGLDTNTAARDYIALYNGDKNTLVESLQAIQNTSARILREILDEQRSPAVQPNIPDHPGQKSDPRERPDGAVPSSPHLSPTLPSPDPSDSISQER